MPRKPRELVDGGIYHVYNRGNNKMILFREPADYEGFLDRLRGDMRKYEPELYHYCLMPNHFHLLLRVRQAKDLAKLMHTSQLKYAIDYAKKYQFVGHVFQERYRSPRIPAESYYLQCGRYIERNPVKAGMVDRPEDYPYSSAAYYVYGKIDDLVTTNLYYQEMGTNEAERRKNYRRFLSLEEPYSTLLDRSIVLA